MKQDTLKRQWLKQDEQAVTAAIEALLGAPNGRKFLWWLLQLGKVGSQPFQLDALATAFGCGELNIGNQVLARIIETSPEGYVTMMQEQQNVNRDRDTALANADDGDAGSDDAEPHYGGSDAD